ncbi:hypothetical protein FOPE_09081 [Fonsecaea pedrosoi]|nr:hypothetical protein FOPE_09081 [Fonsecaea pedrosoi]
MARIGICNAMQSGNSIYQKVAAAVLFVFVLAFLLSTPSLSFSRSTSPSPREIAANSTLGFEKILTVSMKPSWPTRGLLATAAHTGLEITVPEQPYNSNDLVFSFRGSRSCRRAQPGHGSARAWLAHLDMMKYIVASGLNSTFVIEDELDWNTAIHEQMKLVSDNVRNYTKTPASDPSPFGSAWDVLWQGHCG